MPRTIPAGDALALNFSVGGDREGTDSVTTRPVSDRHLLAAITVGDERGLARLYDRYGTPVFTLALRITEDSSAAQEVTQDTFLRVWQRAEQYDPRRGEVAPWLFTIARRNALQYLRHRRRRIPLADESFVGEGGTLPDPTEPDTSERVALAHTVTAALARLPPPQRHAIELAYYGGLTQMEIARRTGAPLGTVKYRMRAALEALRAHLGPLQSDAGDEDGGRS
ncbi:MAG TPA: sigma-70 family RNA polymerase sigma factor [Thermomicrobiales bacterium]